MASENKSKVSILTNGIIKENPVLRLVLGTCSCLAVTTAVSSALGMGAAFTFVLVCSNILISLLRNVIPAKVHLPCYIVIIAGFVTIVQMVMHAYMDSLYTALGVFLPLIVVNCIILGRAEMFACKNNVVDSALDGIALGIGEMGIGNTSTSAAVLSALTGADIEAVTGRGGGLTNEGFARKKDVLRRALTRRAVDKDDVLDVLCAVGGLDIAAMTGAFLGCARERIPAAVDGFISVVAALCAVTLCPEVRDYLFLSHDSYEVGYRLAEDRLGLEPCLHLGMRLGEGSGCPLLFRVLEGACGVMAGMATFAQAAIQDDYLDEIRAGDSFTVDKP